MDHKMIGSEILKTFDTAALIDDPIVRGIFICLPDEQCSTEFINKSMLSILECKTEKEFITYSDGKIHNLIHPEDIADVEKIVFSTPPGDIFEVSYRIKCKTEQYKWVLKKGRLITNSNNKQALVCVCTELSDVMELKEQLFVQEEELRRKNMELKTLVENVPGAIIQYRYERGKCINIEYFNQGAFELLGYTQNEATSRTINDLMKDIYEEDKSEIVANFQNLVDKGEPIDCYYRLYAKDKLIWVRMLSKSVYEENNNLYLIATLFDATKEMEAKRQIQWDEQRYQLLMEGANTLIIDYDPITDVASYKGHDIVKEYAGEIISDFTENMKMFVKDEQLAPVREKIREICQKPTSGKIDLHLSEDDGSYNWYSLKYVSIADESGKVYRVIGKLDDINEAKLEELSLKEQLGKDSLTGLVNRVKFEELAQKKLAKAQDTGEGLTFILLDLDDFKSVNDNYGHLMGDKLLQSFAQALQGLFRKEDIIARLGGDEMAVIMPKIMSQKILHKKISEIFEKMRKLSVDGKEMPTKCSIGIATYPNHAKDFNDLYHYADVALYQAKKSGKNQYCIYNESSTSPSVGEWVDKEWLLDTIGAMVYISDVKTYELIYLSKAMCDKFEISNYRNKKCYEVLQGQTAPCDMCTNSILNFDEFHCWEYVNPQFNVKAHLKDKLIYWEGRIARMEVITELE